MVLVISQNTTIYIIEMYLTNVILIYSKENASHRLHLRIKCYKDVLSVKLKLINLMNEINV
jgi:hypothetical protein